MALTANFSWNARVRAHTSKFMHRRSKNLFAVALLFFAGCSSQDDLLPPRPPSEDPGLGARAQQAVASGARRLSRTEYDNTVRDLLGDTTNSGFAMLPEDVNDPFDNNYTTQLVSPALIDAAET